MKTLATIFAQIETAAAHVDDVASAMLATIKAAGATTLDEFNELVADAYAANGWSQRMGRPAPGDKPAPGAVKMYVSTVRRAYKLQLDVLSFETMEALRKACRGVERPAPAERPAQLRGLSLSSDAGLNGAVFHDVVVVWEHLNAERQAELEKQIQRLVSRYAKSVPALVA